MSKELTEKWIVSALEKAYLTHMRFQLDLDQKVHKKKCMFDCKTMTLQKKEELIENLRTYLQEFSEIVFAYVFGSFLTEMPYQDIDIALCVRKKEVKIDYDLKEQYADMLGTSFKEVFDIVIINNAPSSILNSIFSEGRLIFCRDETLLSQWIETCSLDMLANEDISRESLKEIVQ